MKRIITILLSLFILIIGTVNLHADAYFDSRGMTPDEMNEYYSDKSYIASGTYDFYFDSLAEMTEYLEDNLGRFEHGSETSWNFAVNRYAELTYYLRDNFWLPVGYSADDILCIKVVHGGDIEVIFKDRQWLYYHYTETVRALGANLHYEDKVIFAEPTEFILYESGIGYNVPESVERHAAEVYNWMESDLANVDRPMEGKLNEYTDETPTSRIPR